MKLSDNKSILWGWSNSEQGVTDKSSGQCKPPVQSYQLGGTCLSRPSNGSTVGNRGRNLGLWLSVSAQDMHLEGGAGRDVPTFMFARGGR